MSDKCIGVDVGGTKIYVGCISKKDGKILDYVHFLKNDMSSHMVLQAINRHILAFFTKYNQELPVGIAVPELVDNKGCIQSNYTYNWIGKEDQFIGKKITIESDVRAAALAELLFGSAKNVSSSIYISLGTGLSYSFIQDKKIWRGHKGNAIHFATSPLFFPTENDIFSHSPQKIIYENLIAGKGFNHSIQSIMGKGSNSREWIEKLKQKDEQALFIAKYHAKYFGALLAQLINILDPQQIIIGGGFGKVLKDTPYIVFLKNEVLKNIIADNSKDILFNWPKYKDFSALVGAALSV